jgi:hypothetical protein
LPALIHAHPPQNVNNAAFLINTALSTAACSARAAIHSTLKISPGALLFHRDMILETPIIADLHLMHQQRQALIDKNLLPANQRRVSHDYVNQRTKSYFSHMNLINLTLKLQVHALFIRCTPMEP